MKEIFFLILFLLPTLYSFAQEESTDDLSTDLNNPKELGTIKVNDKFAFYDRKTNTYFINEIVNIKMQFYQKTIKTMEVTFVPVSYVTMEDSMRHSSFDKIFRRNKITDSVEIVCNSLPLAVSDFVCRNEAASNGNGNNQLSPLRYNNTNNHQEYKVRSIKRIDTIKLISQKQIPLKTPLQKNNIGDYYFKVKLKNYQNKRVFNGRIYLKSLVDFDFIFDDTYDNSPADTFILLTPNARKKLYKENIENIFDFKVFTDYNGLFGSQPDGILQTELNTHFLLNVKPRGHNLNNCGIVLLNYVDPFIYYAKFNEKNAAIPLMKINDTLHLNTLQLNRYSFLKSGMEVNLFKFVLPSLSSTITTDFFVDAAITKGVDTISKTADMDTVFLVEKTANTIDIINGRSGFVLNWKVRPFSKFWVDMGGKAYLAYALNKPYPFLLENDLITDNSLLSQVFYKDQNLNYSWYIQFTFVAKNKHKYFFRSVYYGAMRNDLRYYNFQFGYSIDLASVVSSNKDLFKKQE